MMTIADCIKILRANDVLRPDIAGDEWVPAVVHATTLAGETASADECDTAAFGHCPADLKDFWQSTRTARLFEDTTTRWWGLEILAPDEASKETTTYQEDRAA